MDARRRGPLSYRSGHGGLVPDSIHSLLRLSYSLICLSSSTDHPLFFPIHANSLVAPSSRYNFIHIPLLAIYLYILLLFTCSGQFFFSTTRICIPSHLPSPAFFPSTVYLPDEKISTRIYIPIHTARRAKVACAREYSQPQAAVRQRRCERPAPLYPPLRARNATAPLSLSLSQPS